MTAAGRNSAARVPIRVLLADDHPYLRAGIRAHLDATPDLVVVGEAADGEEALRLASALTPDVLVLDVDMPLLSGVEVARRLRAVASAVRVLAFSAHDDAGYVRGLLGSGAAGYLLKDDAALDLPAAIRGVARGEQGWCSRQVIAKVTQRASIGGQSIGQDAGLTLREQEVLGLVAEGLRNKDIAARLVTTERTVRFHLSNLFAKFQATSRTDMLHRARERGWLDGGTSAKDIIGPSSV